METGENVMDLICVGCGNRLPLKKVRGSLKLPYDFKCFERIWKNDYDAFFNFLDTF